jgi:hypothetical protein
VAKDRAWTAGVAAVFCGMGTAKQAAEPAAPHYGSWLDANSLAAQGGVVLPSRANDAKNWTCVSAMLSRRAVSQCADCGSFGFLCPGIYSTKS